MTYFKCKSNHTFPDEPIMQYGELDDQRWQERLVEVFLDERMGYADGQKELEAHSFRRSQYPLVRHCC
jgi:hypothetical protein